MNCTHRIDDHHAARMTVVIHRLSQSLRFALSIGPAELPAWLELRKTDSDLDVRRWA